MSLLETQTKLCQDELDLVDAYELRGTAAFFVEKGGTSYKLRFLPDTMQDSLECHRLLDGRGFPVPPIRELRRASNDLGWIKTVDWWHGQTFADMIRANTIQPDHYRALGVFVAMVNKLEKVQGTARLHMGYVRYDPKNIVLTDQGTVFVCDDEKLTWSPFCENAIIRYVLTEDLTGDKAQTFALRTAFLEGYRSVRPFDFMDVLTRQLAYCADGQQDIYLVPKLLLEYPIYRTPPVLASIFADGRMFQVGDDIPRTIERIQTLDLPAQLVGQRILDLGSGNGTIAFECMLRGAEYVYGCDVFHTRAGREIFKASDLGKFLAYLHGFDGRDLHYKYIEINSPHFVKHLRESRRWDRALMLGLDGSLDAAIRTQLKEILTDGQHVGTFYHEP